MKLTDFSDTFYVRRLCSDDVENIYALCNANKTYYKYFKTAPTYENIIEDLYRTPPGKMINISLDSFKRIRRLLLFWI